MNDDDDFGDLYAADVGGGDGDGGSGTLYEVGKETREEEKLFGDGDDDDDEKEDEEELLYGTSSSSTMAAPVPSVAAAVVAPVGFEVGEKEVENEETFLYGEIYGSTPTPTPTPATTATTTKSDAAGIGNRNLYNLENPRVVGLHSQVVAPGLAPSVSFRKEEVSATPMAVDEGAEEVQEEDWDSDSDDGLQIVLNDDAPVYENPEGDEKGEFYEGSEDDEDEEDLIIVAGDEALDGQEDWGEEGGPMLETSLPGLPTGGPSGAPERIPSGAGGDDRGPPGKLGSQGSGPRIGYSGQGYYNAQPHHGQFKYVRPGSGASTGPASSQAGELPPGGRGAGAGSSWGAGRGGDGGRGDWAGRGRGNSNSQRGSQGGSGPWGASGGRGYSSGVEFNLPPTKTVFDIDLDTLEEKSWQRPGADVTDFFNFGFNENSWKQYCQQLAQLRLEATMQSKIRVYESGRSEQEYDPDLPPELMAAQGLQDAPGDYGNVHQRQSDHGGQSGGGRGRGAGRGRPVMPTGRAIQVEGGGGERRPSADIRRQRTRDSDAVIQIVLQDASEDEPEAPAIDYEKEYTEDEAKGGKHVEHYGNYHHEEEMRDFGPGGPGPWMDYYPYHEHWEGNMMEMPGEPMHGHMRPGMGVVEGHGPFPMGPGMSMRPPGGGPEFGMFPGPFGMPPFERGVVGRPPMYGGPRVGPGPMPGPDGFPPDHFGMQPPPGGFAEPPRRRTPPGLARPNRPGPHSGGDWEEELSNGSGANRSGHEHHGAHGNRDRESLSREYDADTRVASRRSRSVLAEKGVDEPPLEQVSGGQKRSKSKEDYTEGEDSELGDKLRPAKRTKMLASTARRDDSSGSSSSDENSESSLDDLKEPAPARVRDADRYQRAPRHVEAVEHHNYRNDSGSRRRPADTKERDDSLRRDRSHHRVKEEPAYDRKSREDRERREYDESRRRERAEDRTDEGRKRGRPDGRDYKDVYHREREESSRKREPEESGHRQRSGDPQKSWVDDKKHDERSRHVDRREKDTRSYDRDRARSRGREETRSHQREGNRSREEVSRIEHEEDRSRELHRRDDRLDERRDDTRLRGGDRVEESRDRELRSRRHIDDRHRESEDRRKGEDRSTRSESHRKLLVNGRETVDDARLQIRSRRDVSEEREAEVGRNGTSLTKERNRDHAYDERRSQRDSVRLSSQHDDENRRDHKDSHYSQDKEHVSERGDARNSLRSKRPQAASRRLENDDTPGAYSTKIEQRLSAVEEVSSGEEDGHERRGRTKIERWNSRKERDIVPSAAIDERRRRRPHAREVDVSSEAVNADQHTSEKRQDQGRHENHNQDVEQNFRGESRDRQQSSSAAKRHPVDNDGDEETFKVKELRSGVVATKGSRQRDSSVQNHGHRQTGENSRVQQQQQLPDAEVTAKLERRKERFGSKVRLKKPAAEETGNRDEAYTSLDPVQVDTVEVKQERPARKRRWAASG